MKIKNSVPYKFTNELVGNEYILVINGAIGESSWLYDATSAEDVRGALQNVTAPNIRIKLNSGGGDVFEGIEIYNYLKDLPQNVTVEVTALAASAASIIAMGADKIEMRTGSNLMIHQASTAVYGNKKDFERTLNALETVDSSIITIYKQRTGLSDKELTKMLENETWLNADEALAKGFADSIEIVDEPAKEDDPINDETKETLVNEITEKVMNKIQNKIDDTNVTNKKRRIIF